MRLLLTLMATAILAVSLGCDNAAETKTPDSTATGGGAASTEAPDTGEKTDGASATANTEGTQQVSLKLPGMT